MHDFRRLRQFIASLAGWRRSPAAAIVCAVAALLLFVPLTLAGSPATVDTAVENGETALAGLSLLERERALEGAIRTLRVDAIVRHRVSLADRFAVDRADLRLDDAVTASPFATDLRARTTALRSAWSRVPERGRTLAAVDAVLAADEDLRTAIQERASLGASPTAATADGLRLYVSLLPAIADGADQQRNLVLAAASAHRMPSGTSVGTEIFAVQGRREYASAVVAAERMRSARGDGANVLDVLRRVGYAQSRFDAAVRFALSHPRGIAREARLVRNRASDLERQLNAASSQILAGIRRSITASDESERERSIAARWRSALAWVFALIFVIAATIAVRDRFRDARARDRERAHAERVEIAERLAVTETQLDAIFDRASLGVAIFDANGKLVRSNPALETMFERPDAACVGARDERFAQLLAGTIDGFTTNIDLTRQSGIKYFQSDLSLLRDADSRPRFVLALVRDTTVATANERRLQFEATHDPLSRLPNRAYLLERMRSAYFGEVPPGGISAVAYLHIDGCDAVSLGATRTASDESVLAIATRLAAAVEHNTFVARFDGDAFVVLLDGLPDRAAAQRAVERIVERLAVPIAVNERELNVSVRAGIAIVDRPYREPLDMVRDAEVAMSDGRTRGRCAVAIFEPTMRDRSLRKTTVAAALRRAIERDQFYLEFQPIVSAADRNLRGFEALLRFEHPELGPVSPIEFIPVAEQSGTIVGIGRFVFDRACGQMAAWRAQGMDIAQLSMAINASVHEIVQPDYASYVERTIARHGLVPSQIVVEITESAVLESGRYASGSLETLRALGVGLAIDDFGTGYSSMRYLLEFSFSQLKIDGSFVRGNDGALASEAIVTTLVTLARAVGITTVAEGVESDVQAARLVALGVDELQGYLFSRPAPATAIADMLRRPRLRLIAN